MLALFIVRISLCNTLLEPLSALVICPRHSLRAAPRSKSPSPASADRGHEPMECRGGKASLGLPRRPLPTRLPGAWGPRMQPPHEPAQPQGSFPGDGALLPPIAGRPRERPAPSGPSEGPGRLGSWARRAPGALDPQGLDGVAWQIAPMSRTLAGPG